MSCVCVNKISKYTNQIHSFEHICTLSCVVKTLVDTHYVAGSSTSTGFITIQRETRPHDPEQIIEECIYCQRPPHLPTKCPIIIQGAWSSSLLQRPTKPIPIPKPREGSTSSRHPDCPIKPLPKRARQPPSQIRKYYLASRVKGSGPLLMYQSKCGTGLIMCPLSSCILRSHCHKRSSVVTHVSIVFPIYVSCLVLLACKCSRQLLRSGLPLFLLPNYL